LSDFDTSRQSRNTLSDKKEKCIEGDKNVVFMAVSP
jgi:hypothetical protein